MSSSETKQEKTIEERKSEVRVYVTKWAALYVFLGSTALIVVSLVNWVESDSLQVAKDVFMTVLPVATGVITYWFASRGRSTRTPADKNQVEQAHAKENLGDVVDVLAEE